MLAPFGWYDRKYAVGMLVVSMHFQQLEFSGALCDMIIPGIGFHNGIVAPTEKPISIGITGQSIKVSIKSCVTHGFKFYGCVVST